MEFWELTPFELTLLLEIYIEKEEKKTDDMLTLAWLTAALYRTKNMPSLEELLGKTKKPDPQTDEQMFNTVKMLHAALGGD